MTVAPSLSSPRTGLAALLRSNAAIGIYLVAMLACVAISFFTRNDAFLIPLPALLIFLLTALIQRSPTKWATSTYFALTITFLAAGLAMTRFKFPPDPADVDLLYVTGAMIFSLGLVGVLLGFMEFVVMRFLGLFRLGAIARITYFEALLQPFTLIVLGSGILCIGITARLGFFTYNEDFKMYRDMASSFVCLFALPIMVFALTKVVDEEIENRTMLTLMSKPVSRTQVILGKYLGVMVLCATAVGVLGIMAASCSYLRFYDDMMIDFRIAQPFERENLFRDNTKALYALGPAIILTFLQTATLGAISVAISTRFGLAVNITTVVLIYMAANLAPYVSGSPDLPAPARALVGGLSYLLPGLNTLDLNQRLVFGDYVLGDADFKRGVPTFGAIWAYVGVAVVYAVFYSTAVLSFGIAAFRTRELS